MGSLRTFIRYSLVMGNSVLSSLSVDTPFLPTPQDLSLVLLSDQDHIYTLKCPQEVVTAIRGALGPGAIKRDGLSAKATGLQKFTLTRWLWLSSGTDTMKTRMVVMNILAAIEEVGWEVAVEVDLSRSGFLRGWVLRRRSGSAPRRHLMVGFHDTDDVRMLLIDDGTRVNAVQDAIREGISRAWKISKESEYGGSYEFKLSGNPFCASGESTVAVREMVLGICDQLERAQGYILHNSFILSTRKGSQASLVFKTLSDNGSDPRSRRLGSYLGVSLNDGDDIRLVMAPGQEMDFVARDEIGRAIVEAWPRGIQRQGMYGGSYEWKLKGYPWLADGIDTVDARVLVGRIIGIMYSLGFELRSGVDCSGKIADLSFMVFRKPPMALRILPPPPVLCLSFHRQDRVRLSSTDSMVVQEVSSRVRASLAPPSLSVDVVQSSRWYGRSFELELYGLPFQGIVSSRTALAAGLILLTIVDALNELGWEVKASLDISGKVRHRTRKDRPNETEKQDLSSLYFLKAHSA